MSIVKHSHVVPEFYLNLFSDKNGKIFVYDKKDGNVFTSSAANLLKLKRFYNIESIEDPHNKQIIEHNLSDLENEAAPIFVQLIMDLEKNKFNGFTSEAKKILSKYILVQMLRTPGSIIRIDDMVNQSIDQIREKTTDEFTCEYTEFINLTNSKDQMLLTLLNNFDDYSEIFNDRIWIVFKNNTNYNLYTSDHPVIGYLHNQELSSHYEICFPLSPNFLISILTKRDFSGLLPLNDKILQMDKENIKFYNSLIFANSTRYILSIKNDFSLIEKIKNNIELQHQFREMASLSMEKIAKQPTTLEKKETSQRIKVRKQFKG